MQRFEKGAQVKFCYTNSCYQTVQGYGTVVDYKNRYYYIRTGLDMIHRIYCGKVQPLDAKKDVETKKDFMEPSKQSNVQIFKEGIVSNQLKQIQTDIDYLIKGVFISIIASGLTLLLLSFWKIGELL